ncbi:O-antigen polysaccharide polymerase Wzy [Vibrio parahaemolyticus]|nr:O-antigen polysaccharide polymerase Wzy [Vibrio parahaemolyticus]ELB2097692.1 O-antigen polysaccharide polymerase Wzy [Vibrio parahaemolyticus]ELB2207414.1 O-antigen polysaccharide polymerase Wzy [Vibrio parahaemolyticus]ELB2289044.1 O-antigen polysaccharide polymerase Wzy [Vibrio parahaemolyticus]
MKVEKVPLLSIIFFFLSSLFLAFSLFLSHNTSFSLSIIFVLLIISGLFSLKFAGYSVLSIPIIFSVFFLLFVGGRFGGCLVSSFNGALCPSNYAELFYQSRMVNYAINLDKADFLYFFVCLWFFCFVFGSLVFSLFFKLHEQTPQLKFAKRNFSKITIAKHALFVSLIVLLCIRGGDILTVIKGGYLALYTRGDESFYASLLKTIFTTLFMFSVAYLIASEEQVPFLKILFIIAILDLFVGQRGAFFSKLIIILISSRKVQDISVTRALFFGMILFFALNLFMSFSLRGNSEADDSLGVVSLISTLLYSQGTTLGVMSFSMFEVSEVPTRLAIKSFIPFTNTIYTIFGDDILFHERSIGQFISYMANPAAYKNGGGLGSSILSESYIIFGYYGSLLFSLVLGLGAFLVEYKKKKSKYIKYLWVTVMFVTPMLPRSGITNLMIPIIISIVIYSIYRVSLRKVN